MIRSICGSYLKVKTRDPLKYFTLLLQRCFCLNETWREQLDFGIVHFMFSSTKHVNLLNIRKISETCYVFPVHYFSQRSNFSACSLPCLNKSFNTCRRCFSSYDVIGRHQNPLTCMLLNSNSECLLLLVAW